MVSDSYICQVLTTCSYLLIAFKIRSSTIISYLLANLLEKAYSCELLIIFDNFSKHEILFTHRLTSYYGTRQVF